MSDARMPAIVVVAFERPAALSRLLRSLAAAHYPKAGQVPLVISLEGGAPAATRAEAARFEWEHGELEILEHDVRLGLRRHVLACGDLSERLGSVIVLEDDLFVAPGFYQYAQQALEFFGDDPGLCGTSLYTDDYNEYARLRFLPFDDGGDNHFIQSASSRGQMWTRLQWRGFRSWLDARPDSAEVNPRVPSAVAGWPATSWKKSFIEYMIEADLRMVYPRTSLTTNFGDAGTHYAQPTALWQVPLRVSTNVDRDYRFVRLADSLVVYDSHYELEARCLRELAPSLRDVDFECDFYGTKDPAAVRAQQLISLRSCTRPQRGYGFELLPAEANAIYDVGGDFFALGDKHSFGDTPLRKHALQFRHLHKNGGFKRYAVLALEALRERFAPETLPGVRRL